MIRNIFSKHDLSHLKAGLEVAWNERLESTNNLANAETPGFKSKNTDFRAMLMPGKGALAQRGDGFQMYLDSLKTEESGFNLEREMRKMSQAGLTSQAYARVLIKRYQDLRSAMREGR